MDDFFRPKKAKPTLLSNPKPTSSSSFKQTANKRNKINNQYELADVWLELMEVVVHQILYKRGVYPEGIFMETEKYNINVMMSEHPVVNDYIQQVLNSVRPLALSNKMERMDVQLIDKTGRPIERYVFEFVLCDKKIQDSCFYVMESHLRAVLMKLDGCQSTLKSLDDECSFQILFHTKQSVVDDFSKTEEFDKFPWARASDVAEEDEPDDLMPVHSCNTNALKIQCYVQHRCR